MLSSSKFSIFSLIVSSGDPFEQLNSRYSLQTSEHTKPFLRQTHLFVLQSPLHPHRIILSRSSGAIGLSMKTGQSIWSSLSYHPQSVEQIAGYQEPSMFEPAEKHACCADGKLPLWVASLNEASICAMRDMFEPWEKHACCADSKLPLWVANLKLQFVWWVTLKQPLSWIFVD